VQAGSQILMSRHAHRGLKRPRFRRIIPLRPWIARSWNRKIMMSECRAPSSLRKVTSCLSVCKGKLSCFMRANSSGASLRPCGVAPVHNIAASRSHDQTVTMKNAMPSVNDWAIRCRCWIGWSTSPQSRRRRQTVTDAKAW